MTPIFLTTLRTCDRQTFLADLQAGLRVVMVALPLNLAIASGADPAKGLVTAIVGGIHRRHLRSHRRPRV